MGQGAAVETLANMTARFQSFGSDASDMAVKQLTVTAFADVFLLLTTFVALVAAGVVMKRRHPRIPPQAAISAWA